MYEDEVGKKNQFYKLSQIKKNENQIQELKNYRMMKLKYFPIWDCFFFNCNKKQWLNLKGKEIVGLLWYFKGDTQIEVEKR